MVCVWGGVFVLASCMCLCHVCVYVTCVSHVCVSMSCVCGVLLILNH